MPSDIYIGTLLKSLIASKPKGNFLELGTGIGLSLSWMIEGMDAESSITSIDNDSELVKSVSEFFGNDKRVNLICDDAAEFLQRYDGPNFDLVFADAWPGKYACLDEVLDLINKGGFYIIDDMSSQPNWPEGHDENVRNLISTLEIRDDITITKMDWSTGVIIAVKIA
ncbi:SAM-dependent methyltransferase [Muricauda sp. DJ-13]|uniref:SAM-dependent methyltransferase n=2 Tax=Croceivirga thetidis TaxID=2721623 RepID=A0ABX1GR86_9FLAO|nr:SAM-dependent methyltransferase [Croceivirga thetidis]